VPIGYLFLSKPPVEQIPIPDLLDVIYLCQRRQAWYRDFARSVGEEPRGYVGSARLDSPVELVAAQMRRALDFDLDQRRECPIWTDALRRFIEQAEELGVLVMVSGVVGSNNQRKLDPKDFRGFALADDMAPLYSSMARILRLPKCSLWRMS